MVERLRKLRDQTMALSSQTTRRRLTLRLHISLISRYLISYFRIGGIDLWGVRFWGSQGNYGMRKIKGHSMVSIIATCTPSFPQSQERNHRALTVPISWRCSCDRCLYAQGSLASLLVDVSVDSRLNSTSANSFHKAKDGRIDSPIPIEDLLPEVSSRSSELLSSVDGFDGGCKLVIPPVKHAHDPTEKCPYILYKVPQEAHWTWKSVVENEYGDWPDQNAVKQQRSHCGWWYQIPSPAQPP